MIAMFSGLGSTIKLVGIGLTALMLLGGLSAAYAIIHKRGQDYALRQVARGNERVIKKATEYRTAFLQCRSNGLRWDTASGKCLRERVQDIRTPAVPD